MLEIASDGNARTRISYGDQYTEYGEHGSFPPYREVIPPDIDTLPDEHPALGGVNPQLMADACTFLAEFQPDDDRGIRIQWPDKRRESATGTPMVSGPYKLTASNGNWMATAIVMSTALA